MIGGSLNSDYMVKQEQHKDLMREAERYRLIEAIAQSGPKPSQKAAEALRKPLSGLSRHLPGMSSVSRTRA
jgi:hypothetical protein